MLEIVIISEMSLFLLQHFIIFAAYIQDILKVRLALLASLLLC